MKLFDIASELEIATYTEKRIEDLIMIVITEVFGNNNNNNNESDVDYFGKLFPYEQRFESVLIAAIDLTKEQKKKLEILSNELYRLGNPEKETA